MRGGSRVSSIDKTSGRDLGMFISDGSSGAMIGPRACRSFRQKFPEGALFAETLPAGPRLPLAGGDLNCGSRALRPPRGAGGSGRPPDGHDKKTLAKDIRSLAPARP